MNRHKMTLDEAIENAEKTSEEKEKDTLFYTFSRPDKYRKESSEKCAAEHRQLAEWLKDYKRLLEQEKWIPVSERLPEKEGLYLVSVKNDHQRRYSKTCYFSRKNWFARQDIIAWMPLPESYRAESEG